LLITYKLFYFINYLTKHLKINNMLFMKIIRVYDFLQVLHVKGSYSSKVEYFSKHN
jgi:hypothetical protein